jgi:hypothetical protein
MISQLPLWSQPQVRNFAEGRPLPNTSEREAQTAELDSYMHSATALLMLAGQDEKEGFDEALGQPGVIKNQGMTFHFSSTPDSFEMVASGQQESEKVLYAQMSRDQFGILGLQRQGENPPVINGGQFERQGQTFAGFIVSSSP